MLSAGRTAFHRCALLIVCSSTAIAADGTGQIEESLRIINRSRHVSITVQDMDLLLRRFPDLRGQIQFRDPTDASVGHCVLDLSAPYAQPTVIFEKRQDVEYSSVHIELTSNGRAILRKQVPLPSEVVPEASAPLTDQVAAVEIGTAASAGATPPKIPLPDFTRAAPLRLARAIRTLDAASTVKQVRCATNYPLIAANNNAAIGGQTDAPDDPQRKSLYVAAKSQLYDQTSGRPSSVVHYLLEVPIDDTWRAGTDDLSVALSMDRLKVHTTSKRKKLGSREQFITGAGAGGLGQCVGTVTADDAGNVYYSASDSNVYRLLRFNIREQEFEMPPVDVEAHFESQLPTDEQLPHAPASQWRRRGWQKYKVIFYQNGRLYYAPIISAVYARGDRSTFVFSGVLSLPTAHWDDAEKFRAGLRFNAGSWPGCKHSLYDTHRVPSQANRKIGHILSDGKRLYITAYHRNGLWVLDVDDDGHTQALTALTELEGKDIVRFSSPTFLRARGTDDPLGAVVHVQFAGSDQRPLRVFLPIDGRALTRAIPRDAEQMPAIANRRVGSGWTFMFSDYGTLVLDRRALHRTVTGTDDPALRGKITVQYDALAKMRAQPDRYGELLQQMATYSLAPAYHLLNVPDRPNQVIGVAEYGYYLAYFDLTHADKGYVTKTYLRRDTGATSLDLPLKIGLGPYTHQWHRDGNTKYLWFGGYTGICRLLFSMNGRRLDRFAMESVTQRLRHQHLDEAGPGGIKRHRYMRAGLDNQIVLTGSHAAARAGTAYSCGLMRFDPSKPDALHKLSHLSRCYNTGHLTPRLLYADGRLRQQFFMGGNHVASYAFMLDPAKRPANTGPRIFLYEMEQRKSPRDLMSFTLAPESAAEITYSDLTLSSDGMYLLVRLGDYLASLDLETRCFTDVKKLPRECIRFVRPSTAFMETPDGRKMLFIHDDADRQSATFTEVDATSNGHIKLTPHLTLTAQDSSRLVGAVYAFVYDTEHDDGSYDLVLGAHWRRPDTVMRMVTDFIGPRASQR